MMVISIREHSSYNAGVLLCRNGEKSTIRSSTRSVCSYCSIIITVFLQISTYFQSTSDVDTDNHDIADDMGIVWTPRV